eukprot:CAMPEP_0114431548 /NCGR_PEP_ID=MMETSP0103-20121206/10665_1 /TAXON_ID=37642 ORGANISM="Paraphysomonas imperforata, Strain PA2" /NCGR_SAMPLE_ID=MMETSP0103 /ASSEMBLY_ACC=CAM_ASM_000201 /LENGTH=74 /DNA_ID=CAMNT_0001601133 /DNA_START=85 /DNA_END=309 /DNA_ORIENTATION=-
MSSGFGIHGGVSRCFEHFQDINRCIQTAENPLQQCPRVYNDYFECLHGTKEMERALAIKAVAAREKLAAAGGHH